ncbi:hypothetical protein QO002_003683 [Pararhizobium capsulatum DSM 1112]|uniref:Poly(3-hydroxyalkanoate) synthetase n=1 Tax=Pararhizobium capsulatum DSM 1112 TaxID=1121113 RepID=A0ABU0BVR5_9HYPH|nr:DUF3141 domain-containing protein [Pararhizobium capsulatum]MDQ0321545.1 hypothetical protein [Pararhizobium capsulatum DSM 1112]
MSELSNVSSFPAFADASANYSIDAWQRWILFLDVMRQRAEQYEEHTARKAPHVLDYEAELISDARTFEEPVNYALVRIVPPAGVVIDPLKRPFVIVDPRAGHGPGIGGFKADSEIGVAMKAGHACYFIGFLPDPVPGQTIEKIARAEARFLEIVIARHPEADGKPCVIGNCQAGWAVMMLAAVRPELFGPIIVAGSPLAYWAGVHGQNPMRYSGGLLGGSWLTALVGDLGAGKFDGAWLAQNFENQNPANTLWSKQYNLYSKVDTEAERYLGFERWWGGHVTLNAEEMQFIVDELFVGNKLAVGEIRTSDGTTIDLRTIRSPIVVFCSKGDNITPPQQALGWILDLYESVDEIRSLGQTIAYVVHEKVGHLGIFVSAGVARKEHDEFASNIDLIDVLPPGLYEAVLEPKGDATEHPELVAGEWLMRCERRTLDDIRALGGNDIEDDNSFAAAARLSEINLALYRTFLQPAVKAAVNPSWAEAMRRLHPLRLSYELFGSSNPYLAWVQGAAELVRENRRPAESDNPFLALQEQVSGRIVEGLENWRKMSERIAEQTFNAVYGSSALQAAFGIDTKSNRPPRQAPKSMLTSALVEARTGALRDKIAQGGTLEALMRSLLFVGKAREGADERGFEMIRRIRREHQDASRLNPSEFKALVREQYYILDDDEAAALAAIAPMLPNDIDERRAALDILRGVLEASGALTEAVAERFQHVTELFDVGKRQEAASEPTRIPTRTTPRNRSA